MRSTITRFAIAAAIVGSSAFAIAPAADAAVAPYATTMASISYSCQANTPIGRQSFTLNATARASAPDTVAPGGSLSLSVTGGSATLPRSVHGLTVNSLSNVVLKLPVPTNSSYVSSTLSGGSANLGATRATQSGGVITVSAPGPIAGGAAFTLPTATLNLTAGASGAIQSSLGGTSFENPGLTGTASVSFLFLRTNIAISCFPSPNRPLTTTTIG
jgi:dehydratase